MTTPYVRPSRDLATRTYGRQTSAPRREELAEAYRRSADLAMNDVNSRGRGRFVRFDVA